MFVDVPTIIFFGGLSFLLFSVTYQFFFIIIYVMTGSITLGIVVSFSVTSIYILYVAMTFSSVTHVNQTINYKVRKVSNEFCPICFERVIKGYNIDCRCNNTYHKECLNNWLVKTNSCPTCRRKS